MKVSDSALELRKVIEKAIDDHVITQEEYDMIIHVAMADGHVDRHEKALLAQLQKMIASKEVKLVP